MLNWETIASQTTNSIVPEDQVSRRDKILGTHKLDDIGVPITQRQNARLGRGSVFARPDVLLPLVRLALQVRGEQRHQPVLRLAQGRDHLLADPRGQVSIRRKIQAFPIPLFGVLWAISNPRRSCLRRCSA